MEIQMGDQIHLPSFILFFFFPDKMKFAAMSCIMHYCLEESFPPNMQMKIFWERSEGSLEKWANTK